MTIFKPGEKVCVQFPDGWQGGFVVERAVCSFADEPFEHRYNVTKLNLRLLAISPECMRREDEL